MCLVNNKEAIYLKDQANGNQIYRKLNEYEKLYKINDIMQILSSAKCHLRTKCYNF